jgi:hypothetical protein
MIMLTMTRLIKRTVRDRGDEDLELSGFDADNSRGVLPGKSNQVETHELIAHLLIEAMYPNSDARLHGYTAYRRHVFSLVSSVIFAIVEHVPSLVSIVIYRCPQLDH